MIDGTLLTPDDEKLNEESLESVIFDINTEKFQLELDRFYTSAHRSIDNVIFYISSWYYFDEKRLLGDSAPDTSYKSFREDTEKYITEQIVEMKERQSSLTPNELEYVNYLEMHMKFRQVFNKSMTLTSKLEALYLYHESIFFEQLNIGEPIASFQKVYSDAPDCCTFAFAVLLVPYIYLYSNRVLKCDTADILRKVEENYYLTRPEYPYIFSKIDIVEFKSIIENFCENRLDFIDSELTSMSISEMTIEIWNYLLAKKPSITVMVCHAILTSENVNMVKKILRESML